MLGYAWPIEYSPKHRWADSFKSMGVSKFGVYHPTAVHNNFITEQIEKVKFKNKDGSLYDPKSPFENSLVSYLGFYQRPLGIFFRDMTTKDFRCYKFHKGKLKFYVSQEFDKNFSNFRYGDIISLAEGGLDVESFCHLTGHPYGVGYLTSAVNYYLAAFLCSLTNRFLLVPDNDSVGSDNIPKTMKSFAMFGITPKILKYESNDFGAVFTNKCESDVFIAKKMLENF